jgi:hypothetical protein
MLRSSFFKTFVINLLIIALVAVMGNVIIARMHDVIKNLEIRENEAELRHNLENLTGEISSLENLMTQSRSINFFNRVLIIQKETYPSDYVNLAAMQQYLSSIAGANPDIADIIAYLGNSGIVITRYNTFIKAADFKKLYSFGGMEGDRFTAIPGEADHNRVSTYLPGGSVTASTRGKASIAFCYRIPISSMSVIRPMNFVYFLFDGTRLLNSFLNESLRRFGSFQLLDRQGQTLISYAAEGAGANASNGSAALKGGVSLELQSANKSLKIVAYLPEAYFSYVLGGIRSFANLSLIGATLLALLLCLYASWRQTAPLRQLMGYFARNGSGKPGLENEYAWLKERIQQMYARNHDIIAEVEQYQARAKTNYVERLLSNTTFSQEQYNEAESYLKSLPRPFAVAYGVISPSKLNESQQLTDVRMLTILDQIFVSLPGGSIRHSFDKNTFALLIPCQKDTGELEGVLQKTLQNINDTAPYRVVISLSGLCDDLHNINACFEQARIRYASSDSFNPLLMGASSPDGLSKGMSLRSMQHLYNCLLGADAPSALKDLQTLLLSGLTIEDDIEQRYYAISASSYKSCRKQA